MAQLSLVNMSGDIILEVQVTPSTVMRDLEACIRAKMPGRHLKSLMLGEECLDLDKTVEQIGMASGGTIHVVFAPLRVECNLSAASAGCSFVLAVRPAEREEFVAQANQNGTEPQEKEVSLLIQKLRTLPFFRGEEREKLNELLTLLPNSGTIMFYAYREPVGQSWTKAGERFFAEDHIIDYFSLS